MRESGFFKVEMLVIVLVFALVVLIAIPKARSVILNIKLNSAVDSVISYRDNVNNFYMSKLFNDDSFKLNGAYEISNGNLVLDSISYDISVYGNIPDGGYLIYQDNILKNGCVTVGDFYVNIENGEVVSADKGSCIDIADVVHEM